MNRIDFKIIALIVLLIVTMPLSAQKGGSGQDDPYKEIYLLGRRIDSLNNVLGKKDKDVQKMKDDLAKMAMEKAQADSLLKVERTLGKSKEVKEKLKALEKDTAVLRFQLDTCRANREKAVEAVAQRFQQQMQQMQHQRSQDSTEIAILKADLGELRNFRKMWIAQLAGSVNEDWMKKAYSQVDIAALEKVFQQCEEFASADQKIATARNQLQKLLRECRIYQEGVRLLNSPYDKQLVNAGALEVKGVLAGTTDAAKKEELSTLLRQLEDYKYNLQIFRDVIKIVDDKIANIDMHSAAWPIAKGMLDKQEQEDESITCIQQVPWLKTQYENYYKCLKENCKGPNESRDAILKLQP